MTHEELESWIRDEQKKTKIEINGLPFNPTPESLKRYGNLMEKLRRLGELKVKFCPPPKPKPDPELEDLLY